MNSITHIIGIDEAGRGPIAGPVSVGGVLFKAEDYENFLQKDDRLPIGIDSKKLTEKKRELWYEKLLELQKKETVSLTVSMVGADQIDKKGIEWSVRYALRCVLKRFDTDPRVTKILLDGRLYAPSEYMHQETIVRGDENEAVIGLASIVAKVLRDRYMIRQAMKFPEYSFETHKGYGTKQHYAAILEHGMCDLHRKSFVHS